MFQLVARQRVARKHHDLNPRPPLTREGMPVSLFIWDMLRWAWISMTAD